MVERIEDVTGKVLFQAKPEQVCKACDDPALANEMLAQKTETTPSEIIGTGNEVSVLDAPDPLTPPSYVPDYPIAKRIMSEKSSKQMANILRDVILHGTARSALKLGRSDIAGKTGTTNDAKDAWFAGFSPKLVAISRVGFDRPSSLGRLEYGGYAALPLWTSFMDYALADVEDKWIDGAPTRSSNNGNANPEKTTDTADFADPDAPTPAPESTPSKPTTATPQAATEDLF